MRRLAIALVTMMQACWGANAAFVVNYRDWQEFDENGRANYVSGLFDRTAYDSFSDEAPYLTARRNGFEGCILSQKLTAQRLANAVDQHYLAFPVDRRVPPSIVLELVMQNMCLDAINKERTKLGLPAWQAQESIRGG